MDSLEYLLLIDSIGDRVYLISLSKNSNTVMEAFIRLTSVLTNPSVEVDKKLKMICDVTCELVPGADRVSLWRFEENYSKIVSSVSYDRISNTYGANAELKREDFSPYFEAILSHDVINASDARKNPITACFKDLYFKPNNIYSLLDFILHNDFKPVGVICCESVNEIYRWSEQDVSVLRRIANSSSLYFNLEETD